MEASKIRQIANSGTNKQVTELYKEIFGRDISRCKVCQKTDARFYLNRYATQLELGNMSTYKIKPEYVGWKSITGVGAIHPLDDLKVIAIQAAGFGHILEPIAEPMGEAVAPDTTVETDTPVSTVDNIEPETDEQE